ncbi:Carbonic anhydrase, gamma class [hydrothermal vent metagenome]|uniref:Carbonic anhydrase, gamma class n=1 Tax=hydrothermal vent metagenome TaxID=652676 RepID=A0A3B1AII1_9ZZZZ
MSIRHFQQHQPKIADKVYIDTQACIIGDVVIAADSSVWPMTVIRGDVNSIRIGERCNIQDNSVLHVTHDGPYVPGGFSLSLGNDVTIGHHVTLHGCTLHDFCLIGMGATVMDGAVVESDVIVGAGSLVTPKKILNSGFLYTGSPARQIRKLTADEIESLRYSSQHYVRLKNNYLAQKK